MPIARLTDIHLDHLRSKTLRHGLYEILDRYAMIWITGDIANSKCWGEYLVEFHTVFKKPIYFVLGNHDYYGSSVREVRKKAQYFNGTELKWLTGLKEAIKLKDGVFVCGVDGFADSRNGDFADTRVVLNDAHCIEDYRKCGVTFSFSGEYRSGKELLGAKMRRLADRDSRRLRRQLNSVFKKKSNKPEIIYILTHVPPFEESSWHRGRPPNPLLHPFYSCKSTGDVILEFAGEHPNVQFYVLAGHTHGNWKGKILDNVTVSVRDAEYGHPELSLEEICI